MCVDRLTFGLQLLEVVVAWVRGVCQNKCEFAGEIEERLDAVTTHVRCNRARIRAQMIEQAFSIHSGRIANVTSLGIGNYECTTVYILDKPLKNMPALTPEGLEKGQVELERRGVGKRGINNVRAEVIYGLVWTASLEYMLRNPRDIGVQSYAQHGGALPLKVEKSFGKGHAGSFWSDPKIRMLEAWD